MITVTPCAKINLGLNVTGKRPDGYHNLETIFYPVPLYDIITISEDNHSFGNCTLTIKGLDILGNDNDNLITKAYRLLNYRYNLPSVNVSLEKSIPTQAGMGGGSADCAYTLSALNRLFNLGMSTEELISLAATLGADCAFFVKSQPCFAEGIGEIMTPIDVSLENYWIAIIKPPVCVSTKEAFSGICTHHPQICCKDVIKSEPIENWRNLLKNDFEENIFRIHPSLANIKERLYHDGAIYAAMSGSGSALFGIFHNTPQLSEYKDCTIITQSLKGVSERLPIVTPDGTVTGETTRAYAHSGAKLLHPVVHLHVFNSNGELFLQKRPAWKDIQPNKWDTAVGGHVDYGENITEALRRETFEELGISEFSPIAMGSYVYESEIEKELVNVFHTVYNRPIHPSKSELSDGRFFSMKEIYENIGKEMFTPNFEKEWLKLFYNDFIKK